MKKFLKIAAITILILGVAGVLFIKLDTEAAAEFTDNVLRPVLGANNVIWIESVFFNLSDAAQRATQNGSKQTGPQFVDSTATTTVTATTQTDGLDLSPIPTDPSLQATTDEGVWKIRPLSAFPGKAVMAYTFMRPDTARAFAFTTIAQFDMQVLHLSSVAGTKQPGGPVGNPGPGVVPANIISNGNLVAAFDGGFQYRDGEYGMIVNGKTYLPLKNDLATLVGYKDGTLKLVKYEGQDLGTNVEFVRQNCPMLVDNGAIGANDPQNKALWGRTMTTAIYTWRSGLGITKNGDLLFAVGGNLTPETLGNALKAAGAVNAMQLDINPNWVRFNLFDSTGNGQYKSTTLIKDLKDGSQAYLHGYEKDFFYLYKK